ncbi:solute carrier family 22 member 6 [Elysia marginata]|uniref:Solute carrier family 22 member 6 n=1 Tax=Elysia marginata TaxID=1093978 RepID=A0AAV4GPB3_9GAST|nr:solute carrier family 22 member 6 [Elysia marginata]
MKNAAVDDILLALGSWSRYEKLQFGMLMLPVLPTALHIVSVVFIGRPAEHGCAPLPESLSYQYHEESNSSMKSPTTRSETINQNNMTGEYHSLWHGYNLSSHPVANKTSITLGKCTVDIRDELGKLLKSTECTNGYQYKEPSERTFVSEWDLVCDKETLSDLSQTIMGVGMGVGAFAFPSLSDRYGRRTLYLVADLMLLTVTLATAFAPNFSIFAILRFFTGVAQQGSSIVSYVLILEQLPTTHRALYIRLGMFAWPLCLLSMSLFAYLTREVSWRYTQLALSACSLYALLQYWLIDESVRWLLVNKRTQEAKNVMRKAAKMSGVSIRKVMEVFREKTQSLLPMTPSAQAGEDQTVGQDSLNCEHHKESIISSLRDKNVLKITAISCYMWFADSFTYYGLIMTSGSLVDDLYLGYAVNILVELPAGVTFFYMTARLSRGTCMIIFHVVAGVALLVAVALTTFQFAQQIPGHSTLVLVISLVGKFGSAAGYGVLWLYTPELFPTNISTIISWLSVSIRVAVVADMELWERHLPWAPGVIFGVLCLLIPVLSPLLPEMYGQELPQTSADLEALKKAKTRKNVT